MSAVAQRAAGHAENAENGASSMRVSVLRGVGVVETEERPIPVPGPNEVLVQVGSVGVCGSDVHYYEHGRIGRFVVENTLVLGHEAGGEVAGVGPGVTSLGVGQRVSVEPGVPCRKCGQCLAGRYNLCPNIRFFATPPYDGAFAEYVVMPEAFVFAVPDGLSDDAAALIEPLSVGVWACRRTDVGPGARVLVTGAGPIGLLAGQAARAYGADQVLISDVSPARLALAAELGLTPVDVSESGISESGLAVDVLLECSGSEVATSDAIRAVDRAGRVVLIGMGAEEVRLPLDHLQDHEITVTGAFRYANTWPTAISLAASGKVDLDRLVTGRYGLDDVEAALTAGRRDPTTVKAIVRPGQL
jgi:L-iditol 2-dehydrogenase